MTPITERLAEALRQCEAAFSDIFAQCASNGMKNAWGHPVDHTQLNKANCMTGSVLREYDRLRTHPAESGEGRDDEATLACPRCDRRRTTGAGRLPDWPACCNLVCHCTCHNDPLYCRECKDCDCHKAALPPQPVAPAEGGDGRDYVLVPREPTEAMVSAGFDVHPCRTGETKVTDAYKAMLAAAPSPQPVAPERGEAKAVAWITESALLDLERWTQAGRVACATVWNGQDAVRKIPVYLATPQPPPAPRFRDPTIEDAWIAVEHELPPRNTDVLVGRYVNNDWRICQSGYYYYRGNEFEGEKPYWYWSSDWDNGSVTDDEGPTHWMPLPKPAALNAIGAKVEERP